MWISEREAAARLGEVGLSRRQARLALGAGLADDPIRTSAATLYDAERVDTLVRRPVVDEGALAELCRGGVLVDRRIVDARRARGFGVDVVDEIAISPWVALEIRLWVEKKGWFAYVATVCGFVVLGADITGLSPGTGTSTGRRLLLEPPGPWFAACQGRRWQLGRGPSWLVRGRRWGAGAAMGG